MGEEFGEVHGCPWGWGECFLGEDVGRANNSYREGEYVGELLFVSQTANENSSRGVH